MYRFADPPAGGHVGATGVLTVVNPDVDVVVDDEAVVVDVVLVGFFAGLFESNTTRRMTIPATPRPVTTRRAVFIRFARRCSWATLT